MVSIPEKCTPVVAGAHVIRPAARHKCKKKAGLTVVNPALFLPRLDQLHFPVHPTNDPFTNVPQLGDVEPPHDVFGVA